MSKQMQRLDTLVADDLGLALAPITMILQHATRFPDAINGFIFAFEHNGNIYYDSAPTWHSVNGMRVRTPKFKSHPVIEERLKKRQYKRWYVVGNGRLFSVQTAKVEKLYEQFNFLMDDDPRYRATQIFTEECMFLRKKPLMFHRPPAPTWCGTIAEDRPQKYGNHQSTRSCLG